MILHFEATKESRKAMVAAIEKELGIKAEYLGAPSMAYKAGNYTVGRNGELEVSGNADFDESARVIDACVMATGTSPKEWDENMDETEVIISIPAEKVNEDNLRNLLTAKGNIIKKALGVESLETVRHEDAISFPWFKSLTPEEMKAYSDFIAKLCEMTVTQKKISTKEKETENEKYAFRCFLLRLGFIGDEYKSDRKILLSKLDGSAAFKKTDKKGGEQ